MCVHAKSLQFCLTFCAPINCSSPGSSVHGILQARILEWVAISSSGDLPHPGIQPVSLTPSTLVADSLPLAPPGKPLTNEYLEGMMLKLKLQYFGHLM